MAESSRFSKIACSQGTILDYSEVFPNVPAGLARDRLVFHAEDPLTIEIMQFE